METRETRRRPAGSALLALSAHERVLRRRALAEAEAARPPLPEHTITLLHRVDGRLLEAMTFTLPARTAGRARELVGELATVDTAEEFLRYAHPWERPLVEQIAAYRRAGNRPLEIGDVLLLREAAERSSAWVLTDHGWDALEVTPGHTSTEAGAACSAAAEVLRRTNPPA